MSIFKIVQFIFWLLILLVGVVFSILNPRLVVLNYYFGSIHIYLPLLIIILMAIGCVLAACAILPLLLRIRHQYRKSLRRVFHLEAEVKNLRTLPVKDHEACL